MHKHSRNCDSQEHSAIFIARFIESNNILQRRNRLHVVAWRQDISTALSENAEIVDNLLPHLIDSTEPIPIKSGIIFRIAPSS